MSIALRSLAVLLAGAVGSTAGAQCVEAIDFEDLPAGTVVGGQYNPPFAVTSVNGCAEPIIALPAGGTSSGTRALGLGPSCPDFSPEYLRIVMLNDESSVSFTLGSSAGFPVTVSVYDAGFTALEIRSVIVSTSVVTPVVIEDPLGRIRVIEIEAEGQDFEYVDDVAVGAVPVAPPTALITAPPYGGCVCDLLVLQGLACDDNGNYASDLVETRPVSAPPGTMWTERATAAAPLCVVGALYVLDTSGWAPGAYYVRLRVQNTCGQESSDITVVTIDGGPPGISIDRPTVTETIGGIYDICGTISDACGVTWTLSAENVNTGNTIVIANGGGSVTGQIATWDTTSVEPGAYLLRVVATDGCGQVSQFQRGIFVQPECNGPDVNGDGIVDVSDLVAVILGWGMP